MSVNIQTTLTKKEIQAALKVWGLKAGLFLVILAAIFFGLSGTLNWFMAWAFLAITMLHMIISTLLLDPELIVERVNAGKQENIKDWDKTLARVAAVYGPLLIWLICGLDKRFGWSVEFPFWLQCAGLVMIAVGYILTDWAMVVNKFFSSVVRIQDDRSQMVVQHGPYQCVRHPGYTGVILLDLATPLALNSLWGLIPAVLTTILFFIRTAKEDQALQEELAGYKEYTREVRYRLIPGIW